MATRIACTRLATLADVELVANCRLRSVPTEDVDEALDAASDALEQLAVGWTLGRCTVSLRPCRESCIGNPCGCCVTRGVHIVGLSPTITEVRVNGVVVDSDTYALITQPNGERWLERFHLDGTPAYWPNCQRVVLAPTEDNTFVIVYEHGLAVDMLMRWAVAEIAADTLSPYIDRENSLEKLPDGVSSINAFGARVDMVRQVANMEGTLPERLAGLGYVRRFLAAYPPQTGNATIWAPEISDGRTHYVVG